MLEVCSLLFRDRSYNMGIPQRWLSFCQSPGWEKKHLGNTANTDTNQGKPLPPDSERLLEINDQSVLVLSIGESPKGQRLIYEIKERSLDGQKQK